MARWKHGTVTGYFTHGCTCDPCAEAGRRYGSSRYTSAVAAGICPSCGAPPIPGRIYCAECSDVRKQRMQAIRRRPSSFDPAFVRYLVCDGDDRVVEVYDGLEYRETAWATCRQLGRGAYVLSQRYKAIGACRRETEPQVRAA